MKVECRDVMVAHPHRPQPVRPVDDGRRPIIAVAAGICAGALATRRGLHADPALTSGAAR